MHLVSSLHCLQSSNEIKCGVKALSTKHCNLDKALALILQTLELRMEHLLAAGRAVLVVGDLLLLYYFAQISASSAGYYPSLTAQSNTSLSTPCQTHRKQQTIRENKAGCIWHQRVHAWGVSYQALTSVVSRRPEHCPTACRSLGPGSPGQASRA